MVKNSKHITVFEHETVRFDKGEKKITKDQFHALEQYYGEGVPFFDLCYNGIKFNEHVGVLQVGKTLIEVLPKADKIKAEVSSQNKWRNILIGMLKAVGDFSIKQTSSSDLKIRPNTILDLYFEMFIKEVEFLLHTGLVKKYRKTESNSTTLKGSLHFSKHIQQNLTHQERFYIKHNIYDTNHLLHSVLYKAIRLLNQINTNVALKSRIGALLLYFPEMPDLKVTESTFNKLVFNRKTESYRKAIEIARLIILQYHPDLSKGYNDVLALMFDMNDLWEKFIFISLRKQNKVPEIKVKAQSSKYFWKPEKGYRTTMRPDIFIEQKGNNIILDTKWKNLYGANPSTDDLRQMYVYSRYFDAKKVALVYPGDYGMRKGNYIKENSNSESENECSLISIPVIDNIKDWQKMIHESIFSDWTNQEDLR